MKKVLCIILTVYLLLCSFPCAGAVSLNSEVSRDTIMIDGEAYALVEYEGDASAYKGVDYQTSMIDGPERQIRMINHGTSYEYVITPKDKDGNLIPELAEQGSGVYRSLIENQIENPPPYTIALRQQRFHLIWNGTVVWTLRKI